jgi:hypothetical protein
MSNYQELTRDYISSTKGIVSAADMLKIAIAGGDLADIDFAVDMLSNAADEYQGREGQRAKFGFDEMGQTPETDLPKKERLAGDLLVGALMDLEVANTLLIAGQAVEKTGQPEATENLETITSQLDGLTNILAFPLGKDVSEQFQRARFGFDEAAPPLEEVKSTDLATAKNNYEKQVGKFMDALKAETKVVITAGFKGVEELDDKKLAEAINLVGETAKELPKLGKLISKGLELVIEALQKLVKLLGENNVNELKEKAEELLGEIKKGEGLFDKFLNTSYGVENGKTHIKDLLAKTACDSDAIDQGTTHINDLQTRFSEQTVIVNRIIKGLNTGKKLVGLLLPQAIWMLLFGAFYIVAMDYILLAGMDFADTTTLIKFVKGVLETSEDILA